jgi:hypothetical protein
MAKQKFDLSFRSQLIIFGGYGGFGLRRAFYNDVHILKMKEDGEMEWEVAAPAGTAPKPRGDHSASLVSLPANPDAKVLLVMGGRDHGGFFNDLHLLDVGRLVWSSLGGSPAPAAPLHMCNHMAMGIQSVPNYKLFIFGGQVRGDCSFLASWILHRLLAYSKEMATICSSIMDSARFGTDRASMSRLGPPPGKEVLARDTARLQLCVRRIPAGGGSTLAAA